MKISYEGALTVVRAVRAYNAAIRRARSELSRALSEAGAANVASRFPKHEEIPIPFKDEYLERLKVGR